MITVTRTVAALDTGLTLAPERYDPRRGLDVDGVPLGELVESIRSIVAPGKALAEARALVLDTGDADRGLLLPHNPVLPIREVGSNKKEVRPGTVLISRLRSYLRQVAFVGPALFEDNAVVLCSTEFFVLAPRSQASIAFLVPWLLSEPVQEALAAGQEGGHHPRFNEDMLLQLKVPQALLDVRDKVSAKIEENIAQVLMARKFVDNLTAEAARVSGA